MWSNQHTIETDASKQAIWRIWHDVANWPSWDEAVQWCKLDGEFKSGATYTLKTVDGPAVKAVIQECEPYRCFTDVSSLPLAKMEFVHEMVDIAEGVQLTHRVNISGPLSFLWARVIGAKTAAGLPHAMSKLVQQARAVDARA
jgi:hypothetical protein